MDSESANGAMHVAPEIVTLTDLLVWVGERKRLIAASVAGLTLIAAVLSFLLPHTYVSRLTLLPPSNQGVSANTAALAALGSLGGLASLGAKAPDELYVSLLRSDSVLRALDRKFDLRKRIGADTFDELKLKVDEIIRVSSDKKSGLITVEVEDRDAAFAADVANAHFSELTSMLSRLAVGEAQQRRAFFEGQLQLSKDRLASAENALQRLQEQTGLIVPDKQSEAMFQMLGALRAQIAAKEIQIRVARSTLTEANPSFRQLVQELEGLRLELRRQETATDARPDALPSVGVSGLPESGLAYVRARRQLKIEEALLEGLLKQLEVARLDEAKEGPALQLVDLAAAAERKSRPRRATIIGATFALSLIAALAMACIGGYLRDRGDVRAQNRLRQAWRLAFHSPPK